MLVVFAGEKLEIVEKTELGTTVRQVAKDYGVDPKSVRYWQRQKTDLQDQMKGGSPKMVHVSAIPFQYQQNLGVWLQVEESRGSNITYAMIVDKLRVGRGVAGGICGWDRVCSWVWQVVIVGVNISVCSCAR